MKTPLLKASQSFFETIFETSPIGMAVAATNGTFQRVNDCLCRMLGYGAKDLVGATLHAFTHPDDVDSHKEALQRLLSGKAASVHTEHRFLHREGRIVSILLHADLASDETGQPSHFFLQMQDVTSLRRLWHDLIQARAAALQASATKSIFLSNMSHEIRTPMNAILGMAELLAETPLNEDQRRYVQTFTRAGETLLSLINDILDLSKIEAGHLSTEKIPFDLNDVLDKTSDVVAARAHQKELELSMHVAMDVPSFFVGDPNRLRQILINLLGNAVKFTEKGEITLRVQRDPNRAGNFLFCVTDTGAGIGKDKQALLFERFSQADNSITRRYGGTGLGLHICRQLVELMGGTIWVESEEGKGTTFYFSLPLPLQESPQKARTTPPAALDGKRVLVADDNGTNRRLLAEALTPWGAQVTQVDSGEKALAEILEGHRTGRPYGLLLLDNRMTGIGGTEVIDALDKSPMPKPPVLLMLTSDERSERSAGPASTAPYLIKPIKRRNLWEAAAAALGEPAPEHAPAPEPPPAPSLDPRPLKILLVDDSEENRNLVLLYLKKTPYLVETAENGAIAVEKFKLGAFDLVLMDMQMPTMDGYTATLAIRRWERENGRARTPVLALTAYALKEEAEKSLRAGCDAHVTKPVRKATLFKAIADHAPGKLAA